MVIRHHLFTLDCAWCFHCIVILLLLFIQFHDADCHCMRVASYKPITLFGVNIIIFNLPFGLKQSMFFNLHRYNRIVVADYHSLLLMLVTFNLFYPRTGLSLKVFLALCFSPFFLYVESIIFLRRVSIFRCLPRQAVF